MPSTLLEEIRGVRDELGNPLPNAPTIEEIVNELAKEYQNVTNIVNNTGNAWQIDTLTLNATAGVSEYQIEADYNDFYKALRVVTVPVNPSSEKEHYLEFTEVENITKEWAWLSSNHGRLYQNHSAGFIAFYRKLTTAGEELWCEMRPVPDNSQTYKIIYQVGDWWNRILLGANTDYSLPHAEHKHLVRALAAQNLLGGDKVRWSMDDAQNDRKMGIITMGLAQKINRYETQFKNHIRSLDTADVIYADSWGDEQGVW